MRLDKFSNPIFNDKDIFEALYKGATLSADMFVDVSEDVKNLEKISELKFWVPLDDYDISLEEYDYTLQTDWFMPEEYRNMDIEGYLVKLCPTENYQRLSEELQEYRERNMVDLLRWLKYFVDVCKQEGIVWGVGRGSSVASYVLFLLEIHVIDPVKYNLDWREFLR